MTELFLSLAGQSKLDWPFSSLSNYDYWAAMSGSKIRRESPEACSLSYSTSNNSGLISAGLSTLRLEPKLLLCWFLSDASFDFAASDLGLVIETLFETSIFTISDRASYLVRYNAISFLYRKRRLSGQKMRTSIILACFIFMTAVSIGRLSILAPFTRRLSA